jgi:hypothetical protein
MTIAELRKMPTIEARNILDTMPQEYTIRYYWDDADAVIDAIARQKTTPMTMSEFLDHCIACGGNWGGMLLSGIKELYPDVYDAIPDEMGFNAFGCICTILNMLGVTTQEEV